MNIELVSFFSGVIVLGIILGKYLLPRLADYLVLLYENISCKRGALGLSHESVTQICGDVDKTTHTVSINKVNTFPKARLKCKSRPNSGNLILTKPIVTGCIANTDTANYLRQYACNMACYAYLSKLVPSILESNNIESFLHSKAQVRDIDSVRLYIEHLHKQLSSISAKAKTESMSKIEIVNLLDELSEMLVANLKAFEKINNKDKV